MNGDAQPYILAAITVAFGAVGALFGFTHKRIGEVNTESVRRIGEVNSEVADIRSKQDSDRDRSADQRAQILLMLNDVPKRGELNDRFNALETRLVTAVRNGGRKDDAD